VTKMGEKRVLIIKLAPRRLTLLDEPILIQNC
jgi:hypothetical protein